MRSCLIACLIAFGAAGVSPGQPPKKDEKKDVPLSKAIIGKWKVTTYVNGKAGRLEKSLELKADGTYVEMIGGAKLEGKYKLDGDKIALTRVNQPGVTGASILENLTLKDGKVIRTISPTFYDEWTRIEDEKKEKEKK